jgi:3-isopropylmalate/(R)-2-methylmalate dehydratase small subunit
MEKLRTLTSKAAPLMLANIDTDVITPMRRLVAHSGPALARYAFEPLRYLGGDADLGEPNPDFIMNQPAFQQSKVLITGENFGCGSSRETAVKVLADLGYRCVIGSSFGEIFYNNCFQNGILPIVLPLEQVGSLAAEALETADGGGVVTVNLETCTITTQLGNTIPFEVNALRREALLQGLDAIGVTLQREDAIAAFQAEDRQTRPWVYQIPAQPA